MLKKAAPIIIAVLLIILFLYTGISKLLDYSEFKNQLNSSALLKPIAPLVAWALPLGEILVAVLLIVPIWRLWGLYTSFLLMLAFTGYVVWLLYISDDIPCGCGGILEQMDWDQHLIFNIVMTVLALTGALLEKRRRYERLLSVK